MRILSLKIESQTYIDCEWHILRKMKLSNSCLTLDIFPKDFDLMIFWIIFFPSCVFQSVSFKYKRLFKTQYHFSIVFKKEVTKIQFIEIAWMELWATWRHLFVALFFEDRCLAINYTWNILAYHSSWWFFLFLIINHRFSTMR